MSSNSSEEFPFDSKVEAATAKAKLDSVAQCEADDLDDADFTQRSKEDSIRNSYRLALMAAEGSSGRVRATAYLGVGIKAVEKRNKKAKKIASIKKKKQNDSKKVKKAAQTLFNFGQGETQGPPQLAQSVTKTPSIKSNQSEVQNHFDPVSVQVFATPSPGNVRHSDYSRFGGIRESTGVVSTATSSSVASLNTNATEPNVFTCRGCGNTRFLCHEVKYRNFCLHAVMDYFELVGMDFSTQHGIQNAFTVAYSSAVKKDMLEQHQFYERNREVELPDCIEQGALQDALYLRSSRRLLQFLLDKRVYDVSSHLNDLSNGTAEQRRFPNYEHF